MPSPNIHELITGEMSYSNQFGGGSLGTHVIFKKDRTTASIQTPNFRSLKKWQLPVNPYHFNYDATSDPKVGMSVHSQVPGNPVVTNWSFTTNVETFGGYTSYLPAGYADDPTQKAIMKLIEKISLSKSNAAVAAAEMGKTASMVAQSATKIYRAVKALKSGNLLEFTNVLGVTATTSTLERKYTGMRKATYKDWKLSQDASGALVAHSGKSQETFKYDKQFKRFSRKPESHLSDFLSDTWLEYSYGWKPLLKDVYDQAANAANLMVGTNQGWQTASVNVDSDNIFHQVESPPGDQVTYTFDGRDRIWVHLSVTYRIPPGALDVTTAFGLNNPLEVAWELIPFSFVADWFIPIGDAIRSLTAYSGLVFGSGFKSFKHLRLMNSTVRFHDATFGGANWFGGSGESKLERYEYDMGRELLLSFPYYGFPRPKDPRSFAHATSAIALLQSLFLRK